MTLGADIEVDPLPFDWRLARRRRTAAANVFAIGLLLFSTPTVVAQSVAPPPRTASCTLALQGAGAVAAVIDGATLKMSDGQIVRLAGIVAPSPPLTIDDQNWQPARTAKEALEVLVDNNASIEVAVADQKARRDRYGRTLAHVVSTVNGQATWIQGALLKAGHARATSMMGGGLCLKEMLAHEAGARASLAGLWGNPVYNPVDAGNTEALKRQRTAFAVVEGVVVSVAERAGRTYVNFGRDWKWDFTASVSKAVLKRDSEAAAKLNGLGGQRVRVRGWLEMRNGPMIEIGDMSEIEVVGEK